jgi:hypothetical protein
LGKKIPDCDINSNKSLRDQAALFERGFFPYTKFSLRVGSDYVTTARARERLLRPYWKES